MKELHSRGGVLLAALTATALMSLPRAYLYARQASCEKEVTREIAAADRKELHVETENGGITARGYEGDAVLMTARMVVTGKKEETCRRLLDEIEFEVHEKGKKIDIDVDTPSKFGYTVTVSFDLEVPHRMKTELETTNGGIKVEGIYGGVDTETVNGSISCRESSGGIKAETTNGRIELTDITGPIEGNTINGGIDCRFKGKPPLKIDLETVNGSIEAAFDQTPDAEVEASTFNGSINIRGTSVKPETAEPRRRFSTVLGNGSGKFRFETVNGSITLDFENR